ncbi:MAG: phage minor head protein [Burkholderiaceae bacterium]|nr:phage minor head protein [Burkholderiaceae bacterium]
MAITKYDLVAAFGMPPEEAVAFLRGKGLVVSDGWRDLWQAAHRKAFTVAQSAGYDVLGDIRESLVDALANGKTLKEFTDELTPVLQRKGWWGKAIDPETGEITKMHPGTNNPVTLGSPRRLKLIYEQNLQTAYMAGRWRAMKDGTETHPYWQYVAVLDSRTRPTHRAMNGRVFSHDDAAWSVAYPPNGWRCRCRVRPLTARAAKDEGAFIGTADGYINEVDVPLRAGGTVKVKQLKLPGMAKPFQPDAGWDYNPAADYHKVP